MGSKQYDDDELKRFAGIVTEQFEDQLSRVIENIDARIAYHVTPLKKSLSTLAEDSATIKLAIKDTNRDIRALDKATGNVEHRVHHLHELVTEHYLDGIGKDHKLVQELNQRVSQLEKTA